MKILLSLFIAILLTSNVNASKWLTSYDDALKLAQTENKLILIDFWAAWCKPCIKMDFEVWDNEEVKEIQERFVSVKIDIDANPALARKFGVRGIPNVMILDSWGNIMVEENFMNKLKTKTLLSSFPYNVQPINSAYQMYIQGDENIHSGISLGEIYQAYGELLEGSAKQVFLKRSEEYFNKSKKKSKKAKDDLSSLKIDLLKNYNLILRGKAEKCISNIEGLIQSEDMNAIYLPLAYYVIIKACRNSGQAEKETEYTTLLNEAKGGRTYIRKLAKESERT